MNNLKDFATKIDTFLKGAAEQPKWFDLDCGLCTNLTNYMECFSTPWVDRRGLRNQLNSFLEHWHVYDSIQFPFNYSRSEYMIEVEEGKLYENKARLACIEGIINEV